MAWGNYSLARVPVSALENELSGVLNNFFGGWPTDVATRYGQSTKENFVPKINITEDPKEITLHAELPGMKKDEVTLRFEDGVITLSGERKNKCERREGTRTVIEQSYGSFTRSFRLEGDINEENIHAQFEDGILTVRLPKSEKAKERARTISIK